MDVYPLNLILAVATAAATLFLGYLPTKSISCAFFARETTKAAAAWGLIAVTSPVAIFHYPIIFAFLLLVARHKFHRDNAFSGKLWLSFAAGLGISIGVMLILAVTPKAFPPVLSQMQEAELLASIYVGGGIIGLAYVCYVLTISVSTNSGVTNGVVRRYVGLLLALVLVHAALLLFTLGAMPNILLTEYENTEGMVHFGLVFLVLPALAFYSLQATRLSSRVQPTRALAAICLLGFFAEVLARLLVL